MPELKTACDRLTYALERVKEKGWIKKNIRTTRTSTEDGGWHKRFIADGPACLIGSLVTDEEIAALPVKQMDQNISYSDDQVVYSGVLPGFTDALKAMGFSAVYNAYDWNDSLSTTQKQVEDRIAIGKKHACPNQ